MRGNVIGPGGGRWNPGFQPGQEHVDPYPVPGGQTGYPQGYSGSDFARYTSLRDKYGAAVQGGYRPEGYNPSDFAFYTAMRDRYEPYIRERQQLPPGGPGAWGPGQIGDPSQNATGFNPMQPQGITINVGTGGAETKKPATAASARPQRQQQRQALQRRYGQEQGMGRGYQEPRPRNRQASSDYAPQQATATSGYAARTAGMYGGRPLTRDQFSNGASVRQPFGGRRAVKRYWEPKAY